MKLQPLLLVPDSHRPFHDKKAWSLMLKVGKALKPSTVVVIGDLADMYTISSHPKDPTRKLRLPEEVKDVKLGLDELGRLGAERQVFIAGNHCDRLTRYLQDKAPELFESTDVPGLFELEKKGWEYIPYKHDIKIGKLYFTHDVGTAGRYATYKALDTYQHSIITGHTHRLSYIVEGNAVGEYALSASFGWLGDAEQIDYMHRVNVKKNWTLGFGIGYMHPKTGIGYMVPVPIIVHNKKYSCVVNGKLYEV